MKNIPRRVRLKEACHIGVDGLIYASVEIHGSYGRSFDLSLREGYPAPRPTPAKAKRILAECRVITWESAAKTLRRLATQAEKKARQLGASVPSTWEDTRANCS